MVEKPNGKTEAIRVIGGLVAVGMGLAVILLFGLAALITFAIKGKLTSEVVAIVTSAFGVVGSIVGAFFGIKIGSDQAKDANANAQAAEAKSDIYAAHLPEGKAEEVTKQATNAALAVQDMASRR
ncbi:MAG: hypothetical protein H0V11_06165 [Actinobacteria bacterium]|nr:hypothetical protein [Actinomycetota bacterium]